jgi:pimeloyl-ACP methyl ester carboxylesterase
MATTSFIDQGIAPKAEPTDANISTGSSRPGPLHLYKSPEGHAAIMSWYDDLVEKMEVEVESLYVQTRFGRTHMLVAGNENSPALFLIPGTAGCAPLWHRQIPEFSKQFRVFALDVVGQPGKSEPITPSFLGDDFSLWLTDVLDGLNIRSAHFAGTSVGAWMALKFAIFAPERTEKIVLMGPTGVSRAKLPVKIWLTKFLSKRRSADALQDDLTAKSVTNKSPGASFGTFDRQLAKLMSLCTRHYRVDRSMGIYDDKTQKIKLIPGLKVLKKFFLSEPKSVLSKLNVPGLLIFGEYEILYNPKQVVERALRIMPGLTGKIVEGAGHAAIYDKPEEVNALIADYLLAAR